MVIAVAQDIGQHGGINNRMFLGSSDGWNTLRFARNVLRTLTLARNGSEVIPQVAKGRAISDKPTTLAFRQE